MLTQMEIMSMLAVALVCSVTAQLVNNNIGQQGLAQQFAGQQTGLNAANRLSNAQQAGLGAQQRQQNRLDRQAARQARKQARQAASQGSRLAKQNNLDAAQYNNQAAFNNVDAKSAISKANKFGLSLINENRFDQNQALKHNSGAQANQGTKLSQDNLLNAESINQAANEADVALVDNNQLSAAGANDNLLNAQSQQLGQQENLLNFQNLGQQQLGFGQGFNQNQGFADFGNGGLFSQGLFGNGGFGNGFGKGFGK